MPGIPAPSGGVKVKKKTARYPGVGKTADGSEAAVWVEAALCQAGCAAPVAPSSRMAALFRREADAGRRNLWEEPLRYIEYESSHSAASACEGFALAGGRVATFTSGQGLLEMAEILHSAAGRRLPMVFHVASRSIASQGLTIHAGHDDVMLLADAGCGMLFARDAQEVADLAAIARRAAELAETPFLNVQDGFLTTHSVQSVRLPEQELLRVFNGAPAKRLRVVFNPKQPLISGPVQNQDSYMKGRIAQRFFYERVRPSLVTAMADFSELTGRRYDLLRSYRMEDAEFAIVGMGSMMGAAETAVDILRARGTKAGALSVTCFRPFPHDQIVQAIARCRAVAVIERTDTPLAESNPLALEIKSALASAQMGEDARLLRLPEVFSGAAGLGGNPISVGHLVASVENMQRYGRRFFVLGIKHADALSPVAVERELPEGGFAVRSSSFAGYGAEAANKTAAAVIAEVFGYEVAAGAGHGAEERSSATRCWIAASPRSFALRSEPAVVEMVALESEDALRAADALDGLRAGGDIYVSSSVPPDQLWASLPVALRRTVREKNLRLHALDALDIARAVTNGAGHSARVQGLALVGAVLRMAPVAAAAEEKLLDAVRSAVARFFGEDSLDENVEIVRRAYHELREIPLPDSVTDYERDGENDKTKPILRPFADAELVPSGFCDHILNAYGNGRESTLEADLFAARALVPAGAARFRSYRTLAADVPRFDAARCTACMDCVNICPDSAMFARIVEPEVIDHAPEHVRSQFAFTQKYYELLLKKGESGGLFGLYIDVDRCKGCGECVEVCDGRGALSMVSKRAVNLAEYDRVRDFFDLLPETPARFLKEKSLGDIMLSSRARLHAGGASSCAGCGESSAIRMMLSATGFFHGGDQIGIVAARGCHQAAGATYPYTPYEVAWTNVLAANAPADAMGIRTRWDQLGFEKRRLWIIGTDDTLAGPALGSLFTLIRSGMDIKVLLLDKGQRAPGCDLGSMLMCYPDVLIAQTTPAHINHFYRSILAANEFEGPAVVVSYASCIEGHGVPETHAAAQAKLAVDARAFPIYVYDPRAGAHVRQRLDLRGNPSMKGDWSRDADTGAELDFLVYARTEPRFAAHFDGDGQPDAYLAKARRDCLMNWCRLQELAGLR